MKKDSCEIIVILDRSGSMASVKPDMEGGFDTFVESQMSVPGECRLTLVQFDTGNIETIYESTPIGDVKKLVLDPRGGTPLLDAVGQTVTNTEKRLLALAEEEKPEKVIFMVITDGQENSSREFKKDQVKALVERVSKDYGWQFSYLGANVDAFAESSSMGFAMSSSAGYDASSTGVGQMFAVASSSLRSYRTSDTMAYQISDEDRAKLALTPDNPAVPDNSMPTPATPK